MNKIFPFVFPIIALLLIIFLAFRLYTSPMTSEEYCNRQCQCEQDIAEVGGEFRRYISKSRAPNQCIGKMDGEIKNIW